MKIFGTAKGGALSKKDFGVAFATTETETLQVSNQNEDDNITMHKGVGVAGHGYKIAAGHTLIDKVIRSVWFKMKRNGTQSVGVLSVYAGQSASSGVNTLIGSVNASALDGSSYEWVEFTGEATPTLVANDQIWIKVSTECSTTNAMRYYANAAGGYSPAPPYTFWGNGGELPTGNDAGTVDAGTTYSSYRSGETPSDPDVPPALDGATTGHPVIIKVDYTE